MYRDDYEAAGIKMLPVVDKAGHSVIRQMLTYCSTLISVSLVPALLRMTGKIYLFGALALGLGFLWFVFRLARTKLPTTSPESRTFARQLLQASVLYLPLLFALMMLNVVPSVLLDVVLVTKDNMAETVVKDGFHKAEELQAGGG